MLNPIENAKNLARQHSGSVLSIDSAYHRESFETAAVEQLGKPQSFYDLYLPLFYSSMVASFVLQVASAVSSYAFAEHLISSKIKNPTLLIGFSVLFIVLIELAKYRLVNSYLKGVFHVRRQHNWVLLLLSGIFSLTSIFFSVKGGGKFGEDTEKLSLTESTHNQEISTIRNEIANIIKRNTWQGNIWIVPKDTALLHQKEALLAANMGEKAINLQEINAQNALKISQFEYLFGALELLFLFATLFTWYFKKRVAIEKLSNSPFPEPPNLGNQDKNKGKNSPSFSNNPAPEKPKNGLQRFFNAVHRQKYAVRRSATQSVVKPISQVQNPATQCVDPSTQSVESSEWQIFAEFKVCDHPKCQNQFFVKREKGDAPHRFCSQKCRKDYHDHQAKRPSKQPKSPKPQIDIFGQAEKVG